MMALPAVPPLKDTDQTHPSHGPFAARLIDTRNVSVAPYHSPARLPPPPPPALSPSPSSLSLFSVALRIKALLKDESRGPLQTKKERELDPASNGGE